MLETKKHRKLSSKNKLSRRLHSRIGVGGGGITKKYKTQRYKGLTVKTGGGVFDYFKTKYAAYKIKDIIGRLNSLERRMKSTVGSYEEQAKRFGEIAKHAADAQTKYIISKRKYIIYRLYSQDTEELNKQTDKNRLQIIESDIRSSETGYNAAMQKVELEYKVIGGEITDFLQKSKKFKKELKDFEKIETLHSEIQKYVVPIRNIRDYAVSLEGKSGITSRDKARIAKYQSNKAEYDNILSVTDQTLQTVRDLQQKIADLISTTEHYKNQFGTYSKEGFKMKGKLGTIQVGAKLLKWSELQETLAKSLIGVYDKIKKIKEILETIKKSVEICKTELVRVRIYWDKPANVDAVLWFEKYINDMIKVMDEVKSHFKNMKQEFYTQVSAENMYTNYNYNSIFLSAMEIKLQFYKWMIDRALLLDQKMPRTNQPKTVNGGYLAIMSGGSRRSTRPTGSTRPTKKHNKCQYLKTDLTNTKFYKLKIENIKSNANLKDFGDFNNECYNDKNELLKCIENVFKIYLIFALFKENILDNATLSGNTKLKESITAFVKIIKILKAYADWDEKVKKYIAETLFKNINYINLKDFKLDAAELKNKNIAEFFDTTATTVTLGPPPTQAKELEFHNFLNGGTKTYLLDYLFAALAKQDTDVLFGVLEYEAERGGNTLKTYIDSEEAAYNPNNDNSLKQTVAAAAPATSTLVATQTAAAAGSGASFDNILNRNELRVVKSKLEKIKDEIESYGNNHDPEYTKIYNHLNSVYEHVEKLCDYLDGDNQQLKNFEKYKEWVETIKDKLDNNEDPDADTKTILYELQAMQNNYSELRNFYDDLIKQYNADTARKLLKDVINKYNISDSASKAIREVDKSKVKKLDPSMPGAAAAASPSTSSSSYAPPTATNSWTSQPDLKTEAERRREAEIKAKDERPEFMKDLDERSKKLHEYISNTLVRIPSMYGEEYSTVKSEFENISENLSELLEGSNLLGDLSDYFQTMTKTLIEIKSIETDLIDVKVKENPKHFLKLSPYIPEPLSLTKKSQAHEETKRINELVKSMMSSTFYVDRYNAGADDVKITELFGKYWDKTRPDSSPDITLEDGKILCAPGNISFIANLFIKKASNLGITSEKVNKQPDKDYPTDDQVKLCNYIHKIINLSNDSIITNELNRVRQSYVFASQPCRRNKQKKWS